jgi:hypothetical protein
MISMPLFPDIILGVEVSSYYKAYHLSLSKIERHIGTRGSIVVVLDGDGLPNISIEREVHLLAKEYGYH